MINGLHFSFRMPFKFGARLADQPRNGGCGLKEGACIEKLTPPQEIAVDPTELCFSGYFGPALFNDLGFA